MYVKAYANTFMYAYVSLLRMSMYVNVSLYVYVSLCKFVRLCMSM